MTKLKLGKNSQDKCPTMLNRLVTTYFPQLTTCDSKVGGLMVENSEIPVVTVEEIFNA